MPLPEPTTQAANYDACVLRTGSCSAHGPFLHITEMQAQRRPWSLCTQVLLPRNCIYRVFLAVLGPLRSLRGSSPRPAGCDAGLSCTASLVAGAGSQGFTCRGAQQLLSSRRMFLRTRD